MEECRAETVALYRAFFSLLSLLVILTLRAVVSNNDILKIFNVSVDSSILLLRY